LIQGELFSVERLEDHARGLAAAQAVTDKPRHRAPLDRRLADNARTLHSARALLAQAAADRESISPAAEWIVDNAHVVERQIREIRSDLPPKYYRGLPKLASGHLGGYPRVLGVSWAYVAHTDGHFDPGVLCRFLAAYQEIEPLTIGELWAVPITLRFLLVENLRRHADTIVGNRVARLKARNWANRLVAARADPAVLSALHSELDRPAEPASFLVELAQRLRDQDVAVIPALRWLDDRLSENGTNIDEMVRREQQRQVAATVSVRNLITSMRLVSDIDWRELFERLSPVDAILRAAPSYTNMDFPTRDLYRAAIEDLARGAAYSETAIARAALEEAHDAQAAVDTEGARLSDVGYYLIGAGRSEFCDALDYRPPLRTWPGRFVRALGIGGYVSLCAAITFALLGVALWPLVALSTPLFLVAGLALFATIPATDGAVAIVNHFVTRGFRATILPTIELDEGVPDTLRTLVVMPTLLTSEEAIQEQAARLEVHYLSSPHGEVYFALLSDWIDADVAELANDDALLQCAARAIHHLNQKHGPAACGPRFLLLHRRRVWTASERRWMGRERKRGKLRDLNKLLRGATDTTFVDVDGRPPSPPPGVRYVITLDADTRLTREAIRRLIGKMAHPLNAPRYDPNQGRVVEGYTILQPRITAAMPVNHETTLFLRVFSSMTGIDPYAAAASDVYQDLLGEGSYAGKGIYDVDAFERALADRAPPSSLLSHDLFEGVFARSGLVSDIEFVEEFPSRYDVAALRHHRWARGDWQLLPWILGSPRSASGKRTQTPALGRLKMLDNLRRTMSAPAATGALVAGATLPFQTALIWSAIVLALIAIPPAMPLLGEMARLRRDRALRHQLWALANDAKLAFTQWALSVVLLAHQAWLMADAAILTLIRLATRRNLLEWTPAAQAAFSAQPSFAIYQRRMSGVFLVAVAALVASASSGALPIGLALALLWAASPAIAYRISQPTANVNEMLTADDARALRLIARRTWRYFETFVDDRNNHLPPDNLQTRPREVLALRTSPTNIGLYLLSVVAGHEFDWISLNEAVSRLEATLATLAKLERRNGHFYNWYSTSDLRALEPRYVSSVDSGNLAGHLIVVANSCEAWRSSPVGAPCMKAVLDALHITQEEARAFRATRRLPTLPWSQVDAVLEKLAVRIEACTEALTDQQVGELTALAHDLADTVRAHAQHDPSEAAADLVYWTQAIFGALQAQQRDTHGALVTERLHVLAEALRALALSMDFAFLLDRDRLLFSIGFRSADGALDPSCYDLLASEARLASFFAIAKGDAPTKHWYRLNHNVTPLKGGAALISWSGSMFEYLMPSLIMHEPTHSLLHNTHHMIVARQIAYGQGFGAPWGVSESAYNARDIEHTYQYSSFGVPELGLKRGLADNFVVSPYATALAAMIAPTSAVRNFQHLARFGALGRFGFFEAMDFTRERLPEGASFALVHAYMAHHQGMTIAAIANVILDSVLQKRFHVEPMVQAAELLLHERAPREIQEPAFVTEARSDGDVSPKAVSPNARRAANPQSTTPITQLLSNGHYAVMVTAAGSGYSAWGDVAITRWREDATCDAWGSYAFLRDVENGACWSPSLQPMQGAPNVHEAWFEEDRAEFIHRGRNIITTLDIAVSAEDDAEVRRLSLTNRGAAAREIEATSYVELALAPLRADAAHPAFSKLFVETEHLSRSGALLARRRKRDPEEPEIWAGHSVVVEANSTGAQEFETDRARFIGRGRDIQSPLTIMSGSPLTGATGAVLDPIFALRRRVRIMPGETARLHFWTFAARSRAQLVDLVDKHADAAAFDRAMTQAWTQSQIQLNHLGVDRTATALFQRLAAHIIFATPAMRSSADAIRAGAAPQQELWSMGISGDLPIVLIRVAELEETGLVREALQAFEYLRTKRLAFDLVILNERATSYLQELHNALENLARLSRSRPHIGAEPPQGGAFVLRADLMTAQAKALLLSTARAVLTGERGSLADQLAHSQPGAAPAAPRRPVRPPAADLGLGSPQPGLEFANGVGGFAANGREYVISVAPGAAPPAPWINVIANPRFGFQVSECGAGYTWSANSRERQLTPWSNDAVSDPSCQAFFIRDMDSNAAWSPTASPMPNAAAYVTRHGFGYSIFEHSAHDIETTLTEYVAPSDPIRISRLRIRNSANTARRLSMTAYLEWALGPSRANAPQVITELDHVTGALFANNRWAQVFAARTAFADLRGVQTSWTGDRREFIGRNGSLSNPAGLAAKLSGRLGAGLDPCAALQTEIDLGPWQSKEIVLFVGDGADKDDARRLVRTYRTADLDAVLDEVHAHWRRTLAAIEVKTPDRSFDIAVNGWLLYQALACRIWARAAFYQASGAYGFRDQLQDTMAFAAIDSSLARDHILACAARQFVEGDVQHWWLPDTGQGVRTRISDDRVWLATATHHYARVTGDAGLLEEKAPFLEGSPLAENQHESFFTPAISARTASLYEHCARALDASLAVGAHGAPLIGGGDWNDAMNRVGVEGRGESVWLGWFLIRTLRDFAPLADQRGELERSKRWRDHADALTASLNREAWDGEWFRRGWYDDGAPLGSATSEECRIDSIAQAWSVLSGAGELQLARRAMATVERDLIRPNEAMALLFTPPFDRTAREPGYIKGYPPGIRENGGQYTHAALWSVMAFADLGEGDKATALFWMLNPINHTRTRTDVHRYKVEPYAIAADIYSAPQHTGRGGWTWYTGSAGLMHRAGIEYILGLKIGGDHFTLEPCIPKSWPGFEMKLRLPSANYDIVVDNKAGVSRGVASVMLDGVALLERPARIPMQSGAAPRRVEFIMG
jgi:cyclic beta-1,2-glucan synthetase